MKHRIGKVNSLIMEELGKIILKEMEFPGLLVTLTEVETSDKMDRAVVDFSVLPSEKANEALKILNRSASRLQHLLTEQIHLKPMPHIVFRIDQGPEEAAKIEKLFLEDKIEE